jgi:hypothetical protein
MDPALPSPTDIAAETARFQLVKVGDQYLRLIPMGDGSICAHLYDSQFELVAVNEKEAELMFSLPDGQKKALNITAHTVTAHTRAGCTMDKQSSGGCCEAQIGSSSQSGCAHEEAPATE